MKLLLFGVTTLISFFLFADHLPGFLSLFGLTYFVWVIVGIALIHAGITGMKSDKTDMTDEAQRLLNQHYFT